MLASIIQIKELVFQRIRVEVARSVNDIGPGEAIRFDFNKVKFRVQLETGTVAPEGEAEPRLFAITLGIGIDNSEGKPAPYTVDVVALGVIEVSEKVEKEKREDLASVNGASLIYGAIREMVTTLTSRCIPGPFVLPTMDFRDQIQKRSADATREAETKVTES